MSYKSLPLHITVGLAAELTGLSRKAFTRHCLDTELVKSYSEPGRFTTVDLRSLEMVFQREITAEEFADAQRALSLKRFGGVSDEKRFVPATLTSDINLNKALFRSVRQRSVA